MSADKGTGRQAAEGFAEALATMTVVGAYSSPAPGKIAHAVYLISMPFIGMLYGCIAVIIVALTHDDLPALGAWAILLSWLLLSRSAHAHDLARTMTGLLLRGTNDDRKNPMLAGSPIVPGLIAAIVLIAGKGVALADLSRIPAETADLIVLFTPLFSRWGAMLLGASGDHLHARRTIPRDFPRGAAVLLGTLPVAALSFLALPLALVTLVTTVGTALLLRTLMVLRTGGDHPPLIGATIEAAETVTLTVVIALTAAGYDLAGFQ